MDPVEPASWWRRAVAVMIDALVVTAVSAAITWAAGGEPWYFDEDGPWWRIEADEWDGLLLGTVIWLGYSVPQLLLWRGRTIGKRLLGVRVVRPDRVPGVPAVRATVREGVAAAVGGFVPLLLADVLWPLVDRDNRAVHDLIAGTRVIRG